ncbi:MAG: Uma2 family endonuclease [Verrucomicrobia bacterium]|nr:Uma2 family endonuclease [Verrucomicrobiota bacterium]
MAVATLTTKRRFWTDATLEAIPDDGYRHELLDDQLVKSLLCAGHGLTCGRLRWCVGQFVSTQRCGEVFGGGTGFRLSESVVLCPDIAFVSKARLKKILVAPDKFLYGVPDLVVEVLSPSDRLVQINRKLDHYFEHGTRLAWLVNWRKEQVHIYTPDSIEALTRPNDVLTGGHVVPVFKCKLSQIFNPVG